METKIDKGVLTVTIALGDPAQAPSSASGKTRVVASTRGFLPLGTHKGFNLALGLNLTAKKA